MNERIRDFGIKIGSGTPGQTNSITDVAGVTVGHTSIHSGDFHTGVTAIIPHSGNTFREKLTAAAHIMNGFGKSAGLIQIDELGTLETPILLTGTLNIGIGINALISYMLDGNPDISITTSTVNPVVCECNDGYLSLAPPRPVTEEDCRAAIAGASKDFAQGAVGAGSGMVCFGLKGGIGSASRLLQLDGVQFTIGALVLTNFGQPGDLRINGLSVGERTAAGGRGTGSRLHAHQASVYQSLAQQASQQTSQQAPAYREEGGSIIAIIATDLPLSSRQLKRLIKRSEVGIIRTGSWIGHDSGEIALGFSTADRIYHYEDRSVVPARILNENRLNYCFPLAAEAVEEAILNSMTAADGMIGRKGHEVKSLKDFLTKPK